MKQLQNTEIINQFIQSIPTLQNGLKNMEKEMNGYLNFMKDEKFMKKENETKEEALRRTESLLDRIKEIVERRKGVNKTSEETLRMIEELKKVIETITESCKKDYENLCDANNETIEEIIEIRREIMEEKNAPLLKEIENNKNYTFKDNCSQETNWFDSVCNYVNTIFGGNY